MPPRDALASPPVRPAKGGSAGGAAAPSYEDTALRDELTPAQLDAIVEEFAFDADLTRIATKLDIPRALIRRALEDGAVSKRAVDAKKQAALALFYGKATDLLLKHMDMPVGRTSTQEQLRIVKLLMLMLGIIEPPQRGPTGNPVGRPKKPPADEADAKPRRTLEDLLADDPADDEDELDDEGDDE